MGQRPIDFFATISSHNLGSQTEALFLLSQRPVVHHEARRGTLAAVAHRFVVKCKDVNARVVCCAKTRKGTSAVGKAGEDQAPSSSSARAERGGRRAAKTNWQRCHGRCTFHTAVLECRDDDIRAEGKVPNAFRSPGSFE